MAAAASVTGKTYAALEDESGMPGNLFKKVLEELCAQRWVDCTADGLWHTLPCDQRLEYVPSRTAATPAAA